jgi:hypothetical protein
MSATAAGQSCPERLSNKTLSGQLHPDARLVSFFVYAV